MRARKHTRIPVRYEGEPYAVYQARHVPRTQMRGGRLGTYARPAVRWWTRSTGHIAMTWR